MTDKAASDLAKKRWAKTSKAERSDNARMLNEAKYSHMTEQDRKAIGQKLAEARKAAAARRGGKKTAGKGKKKPS